MRLAVGKSIALVVIVVIALYMFFYSMETRESNKTGPGSYGTGKIGHKAFYLLLEDLGFSVERETKSLKHMPDEVRMMALVGRYSLTPRDSQYLESWVRKGNTLLIAADARVLSSLNFGFSYGGPVYDLHKMKLTQSVYTADVHDVEMKPFGVLSTEPNIIPIVSVVNGLVAAEKRVGQGRVICFTDPLALSNSNIGRKDNVTLFTNIVYESVGKSEKVAFIEYDRILANSKTMAREKVKGSTRVVFTVGVLYSVLLLIALFLSVGLRFGSIHPLKEYTEPRKGMDFVEAMALLYDKAEAQGAAVTSVYQSFRRSLHLRYGIPSSASAENVVDVIQRIHSIDPVDLEDLLKKCELASSTQHITRNHAVAIALRIEEYRDLLGLTRRG